MKSAFFCSLCSPSPLMARGASLVPGAGAAGEGEAGPVLERAAPPPTYPGAASALSSPRPASDPAKAEWSAHMGHS
eukprot:2982200-Pyramimonas_sp.AAC.1